MYLILPRAQLCAYEEHTRELLWKEPIRTNDGFDPVEVAGGGKNFARLKIQEILFFLRTGIPCACMKKCKGVAADGCCKMFWPFALACQIIKHWIQGHGDFEKPGALRFDHIAAQARQRSAGISENGCRTKRREEAESLSKLVKVAKCCVAIPGNTTCNTTRNTTEMLTGAAF